MYNKGTIMLAAFCSLAIINVVVGFNVQQFYSTIMKMSLDPKNQEEFAKSLERLLELEPNYFNYNPFDSYLAPFNCPAIPPSPVNSVHELKPSDIKVIAALGDSLTAALGAKARTIIGLLFENRGESWSIGGDESLDKLVTMPNILRKFSGNVKGVSKGSDFVLFDKNTDNFNVATSGNEANHIPDQARQLVERMKSSKDFDYQNDWKLVTLFIGGNDLCDFCDGKNDLHTPENYIKFVREGLDILFNELPRTFVNLVAVLRVNEVKYLNEGLICKVLHKFECPCAAYPESPAQEKLLEEYFEQYVNYTYSLINTNRYERDDFTVVIQPFMEDMKIPRTSKGDVDLSYFAPDCFHFSRKGHTQSSIALWNNMFTPVGKKSTSWDVNEQILCPDQNAPFLCTRKNCGN